MEMAGLIALAQGVGALIIAGLAWTLVILVRSACRPRADFQPSQPRPSASPQSQPERQSQSFESLH